MAVQEKLYTVEEFWNTFGETRHLELVRGILVNMTPAGTAHGAIAMWLGHLILNHVEANNLGTVMAAETGFVLSTDPATVRGPDVGFVSSRRWPDATPVEYFPGPPDFAAEVVSPGDKASEIHDKVMEYLSAGTRLVWVVYPPSKTVVVYLPDSQARIYDINGTLDGGDVLPGLALPVRDVFKKIKD